MKFLSSIYNYCFGNSVVPNDDKGYHSLTVDALKSLMRETKKEPLDLLTPILQDNSPNYSASILSKAMLGGNVELVDYICEITPVELLNRQPITDSMNALLFNVHILSLYNDSEVLLKIFQIFLKKGVNPNITTMIGLTPLKYCLNRPSKITYFAARLLVTKGASYEAELWEQYKVAMTAFSINKTLYPDIKNKITHVFINLMDPAYDLDKFFSKDGLR